MSDLAETRSLTGPGVERTIPKLVTRWRPDVVSLLTLFLGLLYLLPARRVLPGLGGVGRPAALVGLACLAWWVISKTIPSMTCRTRQPIRVAIFVFAWAVLVAYIFGHGRGLVSLEANAADRSIIALSGVIGVALLTADGVSSRRRLDTLLLRLVFLAAMTAIVGWFQYLINLDLAQWLTLPGLQQGSDLVSIGTRPGTDVSRVAGTATHALEFGVVMAMALPLALHYALHAVTRRQEFHRWSSVILIVCALAFSVSRAGIVGITIVVLVMVPAWSPPLRLGALVAAIFAAPLGATAFPGLLGTLRGLVVNVDSSQSIEGRTNDYPALFGYVAERPWFGRGPGTFMPERYFFLDNEILMTLVTTGVLGLAAFIGLYVTSGVLARRVAKHGPDDASRHLGQALLASVAVGLATTFTFDGLSFAIYTGTIFLIFGATGALWRFAVAGEHPDVTDPPRPVLSERRRSLRGRVA